MPENTFLHQLLTLPIVYHPLLSPDRRWVAFMWYRIHENIDVFLVPVDGSSPPIPLTHTPELTELVSWTADSRAVILSEDHKGDERARLFRLDLNPDEKGIPHPGAMHPLTEDSPPYFIRGGHLSPDGTTLYYGANYDFSTNQVIEPTWIYRHELHTGERTPIGRPKRPAFTSPALNLAGTHLIYGRKDLHPSGYQYHLIDLRSGEDQEILNFGPHVKVFASWFPDSEHLLVHSEATQPLPEGTKPEHRSLGIYHVPTRTLRWLIDDPNRDIEAAWVSPDGTIIVDEIQEAVHTPSCIVPPAGKRHASNPEAWGESPFPRLPGNLLPIGRAHDGAWIALYYASNHPADVVRFHWDATAPTPPHPTSLTRVWEHTTLTPQQLATAEKFRWVSTDGLPIQGWLYRAHPNQRRAVIYIHGGPTYHSEDELNAELQYFVSQGFNVLDINYRGSTGYGLGFKELIKQSGWGGLEQADIASGAQALIQAGLAEPGKVGVTGTSYGGYSSWHQITHYPPELIAAAAPICGMTDLVVDYHTTRPDLRPYSEEMIGGSPEQVPDRYFERSPINFVQNIRGKLLIVQGAQDPNVTPENVRQVVERLNAHRIPYELLVFEDEGHGITKPANQEVLYARLAEFFIAALG